MKEDLFKSLYSQRASSMDASSIREICKLISRPEIMSLAGGWPNPCVFPNDKLKECFSSVLDRHKDFALQYTTTEGLIDLRKAISQQLIGNNKYSLSPDNIVITHGSTQGIDLSTKVLLDPGDILLVELPTYFGGPGSATSLGARVVGIPMDDEGLRVDILEKKLSSFSNEDQKKTKAIYTIPDFHNPTGSCMALDRRKRLLELSENYNFMIIEDTPYVELRYDGERIPTLLELDKTGRVIHLRSFSKTFVPGMRLGWLSAEENILRKMVIQKQYVDACTNTLGQYLLLEFIQRGWLDDQIANNIVYYRKMRDIILEMMDVHFPAGQVRWNRPQGGFFVFVYLKTGLDADNLFHRALDQNVAFVSGSPFFIDGSGNNTFRLSFSQTDAKILRPAISRLGQLLHQM